jgi:hypothetical protein
VVVSSNRRSKGARARRRKAEFSAVSLRSAPTSRREQTCKVLRVMVAFHEKEIAVLSIRLCEAQSHPKLLARSSWLSVSERLVNDVHRSKTLTS